MKDRVHGWITLPFNTSLEQRFRDAAEKSGDAASMMVLVTLLLGGLVGSVAILLYALGNPIPPLLLGFPIIEGLLFVGLSVTWSAWIPSCDDAGLEPGCRTFREAFRDSQPPKRRWEEITSASYDKPAVPAPAATMGTAPRFLIVRFNDGRIFLDRALYPDAFAQIGRELAKRGFIEDIEGPPAPKAPLERFAPLPLAKLVDYDAGSPSSK